MRTLVALACATVLVTSGATVATATAPVAPPAAPGGYAAARSTPNVDSVYPQHGDDVVDALHYALDLTWAPPTRTLTGHEVLRFRAARAAPYVSLDLADDLVVSSLAVDGVATAYQQADDRLTIATPVAAGEQYVLVLDYSGRPTAVPGPTDRADVSAIGLLTDGSGEAWAIQEPFGAFTWYAVNDEPADKAFYDMTLHVPAPWVGVSNGALTRRTSTAGITTTVWHLDRPAASYLVTVGFAPYLRATGRAAGTPTSVWSTRPAAYRHTVEARINRALRFVTARLGPFPFRTVGVLVAGDSGMETQTMMTLAGPAAADPGTLVHEITHQWYGDEVTPADWRDMWMNEGMAMYVQFLWMDHAKGLPEGTTVLRATGPGADTDNRMRGVYGPPGDYVASDFAEGNVYYPPARMWQRLRERLGDRTFWRLARGWPRAHADTSSDRAALADWWSARSGQNLRPFFTRWLMAARDPS
jgi:aminopeptidase N